MTVPITGITPLSMPAAPSAVESTAHHGEFQKILSGAIDRLESLNNNATDAIQKFITGENEELHTTVLAAQKAEIAFSLGLQVRNKIVDAYQEIMKMQV